MNVLASPVVVMTPAVAVAAAPHNQTEQVMAVWDTGATGSVITQKVVDDLGIAPIGLTQVHGVNSVEISPVYLVDFYFTLNDVRFAGLNVTLGQLPGSDALIGMDVITTGDFVITNRGGKTKMSFRVPSQADIDYVVETNRLMAKAAKGRYTPPGGGRPGRRK
jgi:hypothetical protein